MNSKVSLTSLLNRLTNLGVHLDVREGRLAIKAPAGALDAELREALRSHRDELLAMLKSRSDEHGFEETPQIEPDPHLRHQAFPFNDVQHAYWIGRQGAVELGEVSTHFYFEVDAADIDLERLEAAFDRVIARHEMLRAITQGDGTQRILPHVPPFKLERHDLRKMSPADHEAEIERLRHAFSHRVLETDRWPTFRIDASQLGEGSTRLHFSWDFIFLDAWSLLLIFKEWRQFYDAPEAAPAPLSLSFRDYVLAEARLKESPAYARAREYWWDRLDSLPEAPRLPIVARLDAAQEQRFVRRSFHLDEASWSGLKRLGRERGLTASSILLGAFAQVLARWSRSDRFALNLTIFNRRQAHADVNSLVGDFTNMLVLEVDGLAGEKFVDRAVRLQNQFLRDYGHSEFSAVELMRELARRRQSHGRAILPVVFTSTLMLDGARSDDTSGLERFGPVVWGISQTPQVWLDCQLFDVAGGLAVNWDAVESLFLPGTLDAMFDAFRTLVAELARSTSSWERREDIALPAVQEQIRSEANATALELPQCLLHEPFIEAALRHPDGVALVCGTESFSYAELLARASALADRLVLAGARPSQLVAIVAEKGWQQIVGALGVLIAGAGYVPIDPRWPALRRNAVMQRCDVRLALTAEAGPAEAWPADVRTLAISLNDDCPAVEGRPGSRQRTDDVAYVIFTSGSTGEPKGVVLRHDAAVNTVLGVNRLFDVGPKDKVLCVSELGFDLSVYDIFGVLGAGGTLVVPSGELARDSTHWRQLARKHGVTLWNSAPQLMSLLLDGDDEPGVRAALLEDLARLRLVLLSGDWIPIRMPARLQAVAPAARTISLGGATEGAIWSIYHCIDSVDPRLESIPYGKALPNQQMLVLDEQMRPCPDYVTGEIHIGGAGLAAGYWRDQAKTDERFVRHPASGQLLYRTGDLGRVLPDGNIQFLGREDGQVKLRGFRVELGEIVAQLRAHSAVRDAAARIVSRDGVDVLHAWVVLDPAANVTAADAPATLIRHLAERLPDYMVPLSLLTCESFPLSPNGKVDASALPVAKSSDKDRRDLPVPPRSLLRQRLLSVWEEVLGISGIGVKENFFEVGGDSLKLTAVQRRINEWAPQPLTVGDMFACPTINALAERLGEVDEEVASASAVAAPVAAPDGCMDIAIVGMAGRFPDAADPEALWESISRRDCAVRHFSEDELRAAGVTDAELDNPAYVRAGPVLEGFELFDAGYFGMSPAEAKFTDPQQRLLLECAVEALDNAGYPAEAPGRRIGAFLGKGTPRYMVHHVMQDAATVDNWGLFAVLNGHDKDHAATYVSYKLDLTGPSIAINTSCSSSLVAVHSACTSLLAGECEIALAGGASLATTQSRAGYLHEAGGITSPDGHCRAFSANANGVVFGSGAGVVVLKRLDAALRDRDTVHAVIKATAINNDGHGKVGYAAPSERGQANVIESALSRSGLRAGDVQYVETHGTGTSLGDRVELGALERVFGAAPDTAPPVLIGSLKPNIGHLDTAAGVAGLIKVALALRHKQIPPSLHADSPMSHPALDRGRLRMATLSTEWPVAAGPRTAGVSSFGVGGTNAHAILQEAPARQHVSAKNGRARLLPLSARSPEGLRDLVARTAAWLDTHPEASLDDVAFTLQEGRVAQRHRSCIVVSDAAEARRQWLDPRDPTVARERPVVFLLPGQGSQSVGAGHSLYRDHAVFREAFDRCANFATSVGLPDLRELLRDDADSAAIDQTALTQPLVFAFEYALANWWMSLGVQPAAMIGHSLGEYVAACLAGVFDVEEAMSLVVVRGQLMQAMPEGRMLAVAADEATVARLAAAAGCELAAVNGPQQCVAAGGLQEIARLEKTLAAQDVDCRQLRTSHAFHSAAMDPIIEAFEACVSELSLRAPSLPYVSSLTGTWITAEQAQSPGYWSRHLREAVRFADALGTLSSLSEPVLLEVGAGSVLTSLARAGGFEAASCVASLRGSAAEEEFALARAVAASWAIGLDIDWRSMTPQADAGRVPLPRPAFERERHWIPFRVIDPRARAQAAPIELEPSSSATMAAAITQMPEPQGRDDVERRLLSIWRQFLGVHDIRPDDHFFSLGGDSLTAVKMHAAVEREFDVTIPRAKALQMATLRKLYLFVASNVDEGALDRLSDEELRELQELIES